MSAHRNAAGTAAAQPKPGASRLATVLLRTGPGAAIAGAVRRHRCNRAQRAEEQCWLSPTDA